MELCDEVLESTLAAMCFQLSLELMVKCNVIWFNISFI